MKEKSVILLSGGLDSTVCMAFAHQKGYQILALSFNYGQKHLRELAAAKLIAEHYQAISHLIIQTNLHAIGGSSLTDQTLNIPLGEFDPTSIPSTYVPARNLIFLSYALAFAEVNKARHIFIGVNALDYSGYPDCRPEFIALFQKMSDYTTKAAVEEHQRITIETPLLNLTKKDIVILGKNLNAPFHLTTSCYLGGEMACGKCDSCLLRLKGFAGAGLNDPISYRGENG